MKKVTKILKSLNQMDPMIWGYSMLYNNSIKK